MMNEFRRQSLPDSQTHVGSNLEISVALESIQCWNIQDMEPVVPISFCPTPTSFRYLVGRIFHTLPYASASGSQIQVRIVHMSGIPFKNSLHMRHNNLGIPSSDPQERIPTWRFELRKTIEHHVEKNAQSDLFTAGQLGYAENLCVQTLEESLVVVILNVRLVLRIAVGACPVNCVADMSTVSNGIFGSVHVKELFDVAVHNTVCDDQ
jgi:hypothetical protein